MAETNRKIPRRFFVVAGVIVVLTLALIVDLLYHRNRIYAGVYIGQVDVGKKTLDEAKQLLRESFNEAYFAQHKMEFSFENETWNFNLAELGIKPDFEETSAQAFAVGRSGLHITSYPDRLALVLSTLVVPPRLTVNKLMFRTAINEAVQALRIEPKNASFSLSDDRKKVSIIPDILGQELDIAAAYNALLLSLVDFPVVEAVSLTVKPVEAAHTTAFLESLKVIEPIASFSTVFSMANSNRAHNIRLATSTLDDTLILPSGQFSYNETVGKASADRGYQPAPVIVGGEIVEGVGGGVCQVSSTLYNALLLGNLNITERRNHGLVVGYLPQGLDATVAYGWIDLKFLNQHPHAVWIRSFINGSRLTINLYGLAVPGQEIKMITQNLSTIPSGEKITLTPDLPKGTREKIKDGQPGYRVAVWRILLMHGKEMKREKISEDVYKSVPTEYLVGTKEPPPKPPENLPDSPSTTPPNAPPAEGNRD